MEKISNGRGDPYHLKGQALLGCVRLRGAPGIIEIGTNLNTVKPSMRPRKLWYNGPRKCLGRAALCQRIQTRSCILPSAMTTP